MFKFLVLLLILLLSSSLALKLPNIKLKKTNEIEIIKPDYKVPIGLLYKHSITFYHYYQHYFISNIIIIININFIISIIINIIFNIITLSSSLT